MGARGGPLWKRSPGLLPRLRDYYLNKVDEIGLAMDEVDLGAAHARAQFPDIYYGPLRSLNEKVKRWGAISGFL